MSTVLTFLVIGAARAGTTAVVEGIRAQPGTFVTQPKEPHYFALHGQTVDFQAPGDDSTINRVAVTDEDAYVRLYPGDPSPFTALGEGSVSTLYYGADAIPEIQRLAPEAKLVVMLRDPVERAHSAYQYLVSKGFETAGSLREALELEDARVEAGYHHIWHYRRMGQYGEQLAPFLGAFGRDQVGVWFYEDLQADYIGTLSSILSFIGLPQAQVEPRPPVNVSGKPRSKHLTKLVSAAARTPGVRGAMRTLTTFSFRERVRSLLLSRAQIDPEARALLAPAFADDAAVLRALLADRENLPGWLAAG